MSVSPHLHLVSQSPSQPKQSAKPEAGNAWLRLKISLMSDQDLAYLDGQGIRVLGIDCIKRPSLEGK